MQRKSAINRALTIHYLKPKESQALRVTISCEEELKRKGAKYIEKNWPGSSCKYQHWSAHHQTTERNHLSSQSIYKEIIPNEYMKTMSRGLSPKANTPPVQREGNHWVGHRHCPRYAGKTKRTVQNLLWSGICHINVVCNMLITIIIFYNVFVVNKNEPDVTKIRSEVFYSVTFNFGWNNNNIKSFTKSENFFQICPVSFSPQYIWKSWKRL